jgi:tetrahydromethanopterin S-methyltransferase subunit G
MDMDANLQVYEALTDIGVPPVKARNVERALEAACHRIERNQTDRLMSKEDGLQLEKRLDQLDQKVESIEQKLEPIMVTLGKHDWMLKTMLAGTGVMILLLVPLVFKAFFTA